ncbi:unnamed protein product, partial [Sphenostylis stenocarpa]
EENSLGSGMICAGRIEPHVNHYVQEKCAGRRALRGFDSAYTLPIAKDQLGAAR